MKKGWQGLYAHAQKEGRVVDEELQDEEGADNPIRAELHQLLYQVMDNVWANPSSYAASKVC